ncbi:MAG: PD-(D/E)XK nuclease family protein [Pseudomonadota bacterium]
MTAARGPVGKLWTLPAGCHFAAQFAAGLLRRYEDQPEGLSSVRLLLPTRRACRTMQAAFLELTAGRPLLLPRMHPLGDVDEAELSLNLSGFGPEALDLPPAMPSLQRQILLARLLTKHPDLDGKPYAHAFALAKSLGDLLDEMQTEGRDSKLLQTLIPEQAGYSTQWAISLQFLQILDTVWPQQLATHHASDAAMRRREMMLRLAAHWQTHPPTAPIIAAGTTGSIPATANLLRVILDLPQGEVILPGLDLGMDNDTWRDVDEGHPQYTLKSLLQHLKTTRAAVSDWPDAQLQPDDTKREALWREVMRPSATTALWQASDTVTPDALENICLLEAETPEQEAQAIALAMREVLETPDKTAALITPDRALAARVKAALQRWNVTLDDSAGQQLHLSTPGQYILALLRLALHPQDKVALLQLLYNPLCVGGAALAAQLDTPDYLRQPGPLDASRQPPTYAALLRKLHLMTTLNTEAHNPHLLLETLLSVAEDCATSVDQPGRDVLWQGEDGECLAQICAEWMAAMDMMPAMRLSDFCDMFDQLLQQNRYRATASAGVPRLRILGLIEARLQQADVMILGGLNEGTWPQTPMADPWMSRQMRATLGLPLPERSLTLSGHDFVQAASARNVILARSKRESNGTPSTPARWLQRLDAVRAVYSLPDVRLAAAPLLTLAAELDRPAAMQAVSPPMPKPPLAARPRRYSVTDIATWINDPYALYAQKILRLRPWDVLGEDTTPRDIGNALHAILEEFFTHTKDMRALPPEAPDLFRSIAARIGAPDGLDEAALIDWRITIDRLAIAVTALQQDRLENGWRSVALEQASQDVTLSGITLHGRADRIDRDQNGAIGIIDYKARAAPYTAGKIAGGHYPQLGVEALMAEAGGWGGDAQGDVTLLEYWYLKSRDAAKIVKPVAKDTAAYIDATKELLQQLSDTYLHNIETAYPSQPYGPDLANDRYAYLSRVSEWSLNADKAPDDGEAEE